uniref:Hsp70 family protein n=1 Tax=Microbacterium sp. CPCC 204701 TaxID=2493084 RepID=UPI0013E36707
MVLSTYVLAVDVGTSRTAASTARVTAAGNVEVARFALGRHADSAPSAVFIGPDELLFGEAAERRGLAQPERLVREFKRRLGDDIPVVVGGRAHPPEELFAGMVAWVVDAVAEREGRHPESIIATVPVAWGDYRRRLAFEALSRALSCQVELISEPVAAAWHYESTSPLADGQVLAVYDLGGGTFDVALVGKTHDGELTAIGAAAGIGDFGGADFDDLILRRTIAAAGLSAAELAGDPDARVALAALRRECVEAKEALSFDSEAAIPLLLSGAGTTVRMTRAGFEELIEHDIERTLDVLQSTLDSAAIGRRLEAILLTGGSSRIPRIAQLLSERFDAPIAVDADPKAVVALGAARVLLDHTLAPRQAADDGAEHDRIVLLGEAGAAAPTASPMPTPIGAATRRRWLRRLP